MTEPGLTLVMPDHGERAFAIALAWMETRQAPSVDDRLSVRLFGSEQSGDALASRLGAAGLTDWAETVRARIDDRGHVIAMHAPLRWLAVRLALTLAARANHPGLFDVIDDLLAVSGDDDRSFAHAMSQQQEDTAGGFPLLEALRARLQALSQSRLYARAQQLAAARSQSAPTTRDLWPGPNDVVIGDRWAHQAAARLWPGPYTKTVCSFAAPFQHAAAYHAAGDAGADAVALIAASLDHFSGAGIPLGPAFLFGVIERLESQLVQRMTKDANAAGEALDHIICAILARPDGQWIARAWLQHHIWRGQARRAGRSDEESDSRQTLADALITELSSRIAPLGDHWADWARSEELLWQVDRVLAEASVIEAHGDPVQASDILASGVAQGLVTVTGRARGLVSGMPEAEIIGRIFSRHPAPKTWFENLWRVIYDDRERLWFDAYLSHENPSYPVLVWGIQAINHSGELSIDHGAFWNTLAAAVFETQLTDPLADTANGEIAPVCRVLVQIGAALVESGRLDLRQLADFLKDQLDPTVAHALVWQALRPSASQHVIDLLAQSVGPQKLAQALAVALDMDAGRGWNAQLDDRARSDLRAFIGSLT